jgi:hypothetical protein
MGMKNLKRGKFMGKYLIIIVLVLFSCSLVSATSISFNPSSKTITNGDEVTLDVNVTGISDLFGFEMSISYDPSVLQYESILSDASFLKTGGGSTFSVDPDSGVPGFLDSFSMVRYFPSSGVSGSGTLFQIKFKAIGTGNSEIKILNDSLYDSSENPIVYTLSSSTVSVSAPCTLTGASWSKTSAVEGESVYMNVGGNNCAGKEINYSVWQNVPFLFFWSWDKKVFDTSSLSSAFWQAGKKSDGTLNIGNYYFVATLADGSQSISSQSYGADLQVSILCVDVDGDGYNVTGGACGPIDCNDNNPNVHPGAI